MRRRHDLEKKRLPKIQRNDIKNKVDTPYSWEELLIKPLYKKKGSIKLLENQRGTGECTPNEHGTPNEHKYFWADKTSLTREPVILA